MARRTRVSSSAGLPRLAGSCWICAYRVCVAVTKIWPSSDAAHFLLSTCTSCLVVTKPVVVLVHLERELEIARRNWAGVMPHGLGPYAPRSDHRSVRGHGPRPVRL